MSDVTEQFNGIEMLPVTQKKTAGTDGEGAQGVAVAETLVKEVQRQATSLSKFLGDLIELTYEGRRAFRKAIKEHLDAMREYVKANEGDLVYAKAFRSAEVRLSEAKVFSESVDSGFSPDMSQNYHTLVAQARAFKEAKASGENGAVGPTVKRGRKPTPVVEKFRKWVEDQHPSKEEIQRMREMLSQFEQVAE